MAELRLGHGHIEPSASLDYHNPRCQMEQYSSLWKYSQSRIRTVFEGGFLAAYLTILLFGLDW